MISLPKPLRNELFRTVLAARKLAETAAVKALHALGVDEADAPGHLDNEGRLLRRRLRAQARQLGDREDPLKKGCYETRHLTGKIAYDHWHRLLFARFLAENDLLISPDHGVDWEYLRFTKVARSSRSGSSDTIPDRDGLATIPDLLRSVGYKTLDDWLRNGFFEQHCKLFHQRPFIWHIWDGLRDGFSALVNYHRLDRAMLEKLTYTFAESEFEKYRIVQDRLFESDFDRHIKKALKDGNP